MGYVSCFSIVTGASLALLLVVVPCTAGAGDRLENVSIEFNGGSRVDQLDWNIAGNTAGNNPNILSELSWDDLEIFEVNTKIQLVMVNDRLPFKSTIKAIVSYGEIQSGTNQDSDYFLDNRTGEQSRSNNLANRGSVFDFTLGGGPIFSSRDRRLVFVPLAGFSQHTQDLTMHDGVQTIPNDGAFPGLDSSYDAEWRSFWLGCDFAFQATPSLGFHSSVELHFAEYEAVANWNLRRELSHPESFSHYSDMADGLVSSIGVTFGVRNVLVNLDLNYKKWQAEDGLDTVYFSDGTFSFTRLNEVNWESFGVSTGLTVRF